jgi:hypothetical protein
VLDGQLPVISTQPATRTVCATATAVFSVVSTNAVSYQWEQWNGSTWVAISGTTTASLSLPNTTVSMNTNTYRVKVIGLCTVITSGTASLFVNPLPTITLTASRPAALLPGQSLTISTTVNPGGGGFAWYKNLQVMTGITSNNLPGLTVDNIGTYRAVYTDPNGCVTTSADLIVSGQASDNLYVYPNPSNGQFQVRFYNSANEAVSVTIYDDKGAKVYSRGLVTTISYTKIDVDISRLPEGIYMVEVMNAAGKRIGVKKIIKQR